MMISLQNVTKYYRNKKVIDQVSFEVNASEPLVILGRSGSGKTTLLRLIAGLEIPDEGEIYINGTIASKPGWALAPHSRSIGFVFQTAALWPHMTVSQNIMFGLQEIPAKEAHDRLDELLQRASLTELANRYPNQISGGEARRVALLRALAPYPRCLLLDEPLTNLDPNLKDDMLSLIKENIRKTGASLVFVTHDEGESRQISKRILRLDRGNLLQTHENMKDKHG